MRPKWGGGGNPMIIGPVTFNNALSFGTLNVQRHWLQDESVHDGFHMLCAILNSENVAVCCFQEPRAGAFPTLPADQCYHCDGPVESRGREAAFLYRSGVSCIPIPGVQDTVSMRWRNFQGMICVCSHYAPHIGLSEVDRVGFWQELIVVARHVRSTKDLPLLIAGDANVWHPEFSLGRSRSQDADCPFGGFVGLFTWARVDQSA